MGLVERYANKSFDTPHLRKLANLKPERRPVRRAVPKKARRLNTSELALFASRYRTGATVMQLAEEFEIHRTTVMHLTAKLDIKRLPRRLSGIDVQLAAEQYRQGETLAVVAKQFGVGVENMRTQLLAAGEEIRPRGRPARH